MGYIGQMRQRLEVLPERGSEAAAPPEHSGPRADELPVLLPADAQSVTVAVPREPTDEGDRE